MNNDAPRARWSLRRGLVTLIVYIVINVLLYLACKHIGHFSRTPSILIASFLALSVTGWLVRPFRRAAAAELRSA